MTRYILLLLSVLPLSAFGNDARARDDLLWGYAEFLQSLETGDFAVAQKYVAPDTKIGFGGDDGPAGFRVAVIDTPRCIEDLVFALRQGCRLVAGGGESACISPPQFADPEVLYLGARLKFVQAAGKALSIQYLICGGD